MAKFSVFKDQESLFACPICQAPMHLDLSSLICQNRHTFNIAKQGACWSLKGSARCSSPVKVTKSCCRWSRQSTRAGAIAST